MDDLFRRYQVRKHYITAIAIPDRTGQDIGGDPQTMMISPISEMNRRSDAFAYLYLPVTFSGYTPNSETGRVDINYIVQYLHMLSAQDKRDFRLADYYIVASISALDKGVTQRSAGGGIDFKLIGVGAQADEMVSVITSDFNVAKGANFQIINGMNTTNSVSVVRRGKGGDLDARFSGVGLSFNASLDRSEGSHAALRNLIQLSTIETLGKLAKVPYQQCLQQRQATPRLVSSSGRASIRLATDRGAQPHYQPGDKLRLSLTTSANLRVRCYYRDGAGAIVKIYPNRFQPQAAIRANTRVAVPPGGRFDIVFEQAGVSEQVMCLGTPLAVGSGFDPLVSNLPASLLRNDLQPIAAASLDDIAAAYRRIVPDDLVRSDLKMRVD